MPVLPGTGSLAPRLQTTTLGHVMSSMLQRTVEQAVTKAPMLPHGDSLSDRQGPPLRAICRSAAAKAAQASADTTRRDPLTVDPFARELYSHAGRNSLVQRNFPAVPPDWPTGRRGPRRPVVPPQQQCDEHSSCRGMSPLRLLSCQLVRFNPQNSGLGRDAISTKRILASSSDLRSGAMPRKQTYLARQRPAGGNLLKRQAQRSTIDSIRGRLACLEGMRP